MTLNKLMFKLLYTLKEQTSKEFQNLDHEDVRSVTYIRVTGNSIYQPDRYVGVCDTCLTPGAPFIVYTKWRRSLEKPTYLYEHLKSELRCK